MHAAPEDPAVGAFRSADFDCQISERDQQKDRPVEKDGGRCITVRGAAVAVRRHAGNSRDRFVGFYQSSDDKGCPTRTGPLNKMIVDPDRTVIGRSDDAAALSLP